MLKRENPNINTYVEYDHFAQMNFKFNATDPKYNFAFAFGIAGF